MITKKELEKMRRASWLIADPAGEVVNNLIDEYERLKRTLDCRAGRLLLRRKPCFVVKASEPYARQVVDLIKADQGGKWTEEDERWATAALAGAGETEKEGR